MVYGLSDSAYFLSIGVTAWGTLLSIALVVVWAVVACKLQHLSRGLAAAIVVLAVPVLLVHTRGDRIQLRADGARKTQWFREVEYVEWRHVASAEPESRTVVNRRGAAYVVAEVVLRLRTGDEWPIEVTGLNPRERERVLAFARERLSPSP